MFTDVNEVLSVDDVMELLYIGRNSAYRLLRSGELKAFRVGRVWRIPRSSLSEFIVTRCGRQDDRQTQQQ